MTDAMGDKIPGINPAPDALGGDVKLSGCLFDGEQSGQRMFGHNYGVVIHDSVSWSLGWWAEDWPIPLLAVMGGDADAAIHSRAAWRASSDASCRRLSASLIVWGRGVLFVISPELRGYVDILTGPTFYVKAQKLGLQLYIDGAGFLVRACRAL